MKSMDKIAVKVARLMNFNPEKKDKALGKFKKIEKQGNAFRFKVKSGFEKNTYNVEAFTIELYKKKAAEPKKLIFYVHGGAFIAGLTNTYRAMHKEFIRNIEECAVAFIEYRTAPEFVYPAAHNDVMAAWEFVQEQLGFSSQDIVIAGDSAGGNLVLSLLLKLSAENKAMPKAVVAISPWTDMLASGESYRKLYQVDAIFGRKKGVLSDEVLKSFLNSSVFAYSQNCDRLDYYVSPVYGNYQNLPPIMFVVGECEMLLDDTMTIYNKVKEADGEAKLIVGEGMFHTYPLCYRFSYTAKKDFKEIIDFCNEKLDKER